MECHRSATVNKDSAMLSVKDRGAPTLLHALRHVKLYLRLKTALWCAALAPFQEPKVPAITFKAD
jgi:hypothetical protein